MQADQHEHTTKTALLNVNVAGPATSQSVSLTGTIVVPAFTLSPTSLSFGNQLHGTTSAPQTVTVTNTGTVASLTIDSILLWWHELEAIHSNQQLRHTPSDPCAGNSCTITVQFAPTKAGATTASLTVHVRLLHPINQYRSRVRANK